MTNFAFKLFLSLIIFFSLVSANAQQSECTHIYPTEHDNVTQNLSFLGCTPNISFDDYDLMAPFTMYVNFHFIENIPVQDGLQLVDDLLW